MFEEKKKTEKPQRKAWTSASTAKAHGRWPRLFQPLTFHFQANLESISKMERGPLPFLLQEVATWKANVWYLWILRCSMSSVDKLNSFIHFKIFRLKLPASFSSMNKPLHNFFPVADSPPLIIGHLTIAYFKWLQNFIHHEAYFSYWKQ